MLEIRITIEAPEIARAINNLASAIAGGKVQALIPVESVIAKPEPAPVKLEPVIAKPEQKIAAVPVAMPPQYTREQIMQAGAALMDAGKSNELIKLLQSFNVQAVMELKPEQFGAFATALREMGAQI